MFRVVVGLLLALLATAGTALAWPSAQRLRVDLSAGVPNVERQASYVSSQPIQLRVRAAQASSATVIGVGPDGSNLRLPLVRDAAGFANTLRLPLAGAWSLAVATDVGADERTTQSFAVDVTDGSALLGQAALCLALGIGSIAAGLALLSVRRRATTLA